MRNIKIFLMVFSLLCSLAGCSRARDTEGDVTPVPLPTCTDTPSPSFTPTVSEPSPSPSVPAEPVLLPRPSSEAFSLSGTDAVLYDALAEYYSWRGSDNDLLLPALSILDCYTVDKDTACYTIDGDTVCYYICWFYQLDYYNLAYGLSDLSSPSYIFSGGRVLCRLIVHQDADGIIQKVEIDECGDGMGYPDDVRQICAPNETLAEEIIQNLPLTADVRNVADLSQNDMLNQYLDFFFR